jgi:hypothetical protein
MSSQIELNGVINRREAVRRVSAMLGGIAFVGGTALLTACEKERAAPAAKADAPTVPIGEFTVQDIAFLDEIADTILPETSTPGAKAAKVGAFIALMVTDTYDAEDRKRFRDGMPKVDAASQKAHNVAFMSATPQQRLTVIEALDKEQKEHTDARERAREKAAPKKADEKQADKFLPDQRKENVPGQEVTGAEAITADTPSHYFRMMKELTMLGYFTSEIGYTKAMRYIESPGRFDPCVPYKAGETSWASHA